MKTLYALATVAGADYREETYQGRPHLVVPVVGLVEGVIHAMNSDTAELVLAEEFSKAPVGWNGRPVFYGHPLKRGRPVSGGAPDVMEAACVGIVFQAAAILKKLKMEAWIDVEKANAVDASLVARILEKAAIEISVGVFADVDNTSGEFAGKKYEGVWHDLMPDHLALLPAGDTGACSREMGCGVRAASQKGPLQMKHMYEAWLEPGPETVEMLKTLRNIPQSERDKMDAADFAGPNQSFPIAKPEDVAAAATSLGRAKGNRDAIKKKIVSIAYRKGADYVAQLPEAWKKKKDQKNASVFAKMMEAIRGAVSADVSDQDVRRELSDAVKAMEPGMFCIEAVFADRVVYSVYEQGGGYCLYQRAYTEANGAYTVDGNRVEVEVVQTFEPVMEPNAAAGARHSKKDMEVVQSMHDQAIMLGATCPEPKAASGATKEEETNMTKCERIKALIAKQPKLFTAADEKMLGEASEETLVRFEAIEAPTTEVKTPVVASAAAPVVETPKAVNFEDVLKTASADVRELVTSGLAVGQAKKDTTIATLKASKRCTFTDEKLKAMSQAELDQLVALADIKTAAVDYSGAGVARTDGDGPKPVPAAPDLNARVLASRQPVKA